MKLSPYPEYKDSGVEWIGDIPEGWETHRFKINFKYIKGRIPENLQEESNENSLPYLSMDYLRGKSEVLYSDNDPKAIKINDGDLLLLWDGSNAGEFVEGKKGYLSSTMVKLSLENIDLKYSNYLCRAFEPLLRDLTIGMGIPHVNGDNLGNIRITHPNIKEQKSIVSFLDKKTSEIDKTIEKDTRLIELLQEKRTALINHVVTKGLDPETTMKDSGVKWIGKIPEGWEVRRLKYNCLVNPPGKKSLADPSVKVNFLPMEKVSEDGKYDLESKAAYENVSSGYTYFENEDVLLAKITPCFENGKGALVENLEYGFGFGTTEFHVLRFGENINANYIYYLTKSHLFRVLGEAFMEGAAGQKRVSTDFVKDFPMATPNLMEQKQIVEYLDKKTSNIHKTIQKIQTIIDLLQEYKKSLIHHVVTGKVDVRDVL